MLSEQDFRLQADRALEGLQQALLPAADEDGFEVELQNGVLQVIFDEPSPAKFVVSPNAPVRQIWVERSSTRISSSEKCSCHWSGSAMASICSLVSPRCRAEPR